MTDRDVDMINVEMMRANEPSFEGITPEMAVQVYVAATAHNHSSK